MFKLFLLLQIHKRVHKIFAIGFVNSKFQLPINLLLNKHSIV